ncbi:SAM-dependent methyltransferase [Lentzea sp. NBC_00516]|uniref:SAM-dependent methyltransferase n=1 Tax=Lentzea sp. NBC_00516 TaxID=2903582 RepID=UPI002E815C9A|nr:SAM-dependent methyltransferase [Lentzea sp. NBC_00516]WUD25417.1 SAM-dependent methyltransferase [Lentzea sp. NBC_00516]
MATPIWAPGVNGPERPNTARVRDYWLGGTHNTEADQELAAHLVSAAPHLPYLCRTHRSFLGRVVRRLTALGVRQFIDLGSGLPTAGHVHLAAPDARVVYVDVDPAVAAEGREIIADEPRVSYLCADLCDPEKVLESQEIRSTLDLSEPIAVLVLDVLHFVPDDAEPYKVLAKYLNALAPGSHLGLSHTCRDPFMLAAVGLFGAMYGDQPLPAFTFRYPEQVVRFFDGMEVLEPGVVPIPLWEPDPGEVQDRNPENFHGSGGLARKL